MVSRCDLRQRPRISYCEPADPDLDEYIYCDECEDYVYEYCAIHGPLLVVPDDKIPAVPPHPPFVPLSAYTIPHRFLHINYSYIPEAGLGVFSSRTLPRGVRFGPYRGQRLPPAASAAGSLYCWQIQDPQNRRRSHLIDGSDPNNSNWLRYVNCARHYSEQNLVAFQYQGQLYYRTIKIIPRFTELLVFYGTEFALSLHIDLKLFNKPQGRAALTYADIKELHKIRRSNARSETITEEKKGAEPEYVEDIAREEKKTQTVRKDSINKNKDKEKSLRETSKANITKNIAKEKITVKDNTKIDTKETSQVESKILLPKSTSIDHKTLNSDGIKNGKATATNKNIYFSCDLCSFVTSLKNKLIEHMGTHEMCLCEICDRTFNRIDDLNTHLLVHAGKLFPCDICKRKYKTKSFLNLHKRIHSGDKLYKCDVCDKRFAKICHLKQHSVIHTGVRPYQCDVCDKRFTQKSHLNIHLRSHTGVRPYQCNVCDKRFTRISHLNRHLRSHTGVRPYQCNVCDKRFTRIGHLKRHSRIHTGVRPYQCGVCDKRFTNSGDLKRHSRVHTGVRPYQCGVCDKGFTNSSDLKRHSRVHTGVRPYQCGVCDKRFTNSGDLKSHSRIHTGEKPFQCGVCDKRFAHSSSLKHHSRTHTGDKQTV